MKTFNYLLPACLLLASFITQAQYFMPELSSEMLMVSKEVYVVTNNGDTLTGKINSATLVGGQLKAFSIKQNNAKGLKFKAPDVRLLAVKPNKMANIESALSVPNLSRAMELDYDAIINREWVYFEQALLPKKSDKYVLMQLLNSGFDSKIKVYLDPNAQKTATLGIEGVAITGGEDKSYLVVFDGNKAEIYKKSRYRKEALGQLYKNCEVFVENYEGEKFKWKDFSEHVFVYDQLCK